jgi:hypothetical protein
MTTLALLLGGVLAAASVVFVARPFLREPALTSADDRLDVLGPEEANRLVLLQERDRALAALKELEVDHRSGKISDEDYRELVSSLRADAARALRALDPPG